MSVYQILTRDGIADPGTAQQLAALEADLAKPGAKLLLHLHGGLVDEAAGRAAATTLSGTGPHSWNLDDEWTQVYIIWRTGAFETIRTNWEDLAHDDRLYQVILRKLIGFVARKLGIPAVGARGTARSVAETFQLDEAEIQQRIIGNGDRRAPFADADARLGTHPVEGLRAVLTPQQSNGALSLEFQEELRSDIEFNAAVADIDGVVNERAVGRGPLPGGDRARGMKSLNRLTNDVRTELKRPQEPGTRGIVAVGAFMLQHAGNIAFRCFRRFRTNRDHGLHATVVEEVCRELYADLVGAKVWGMMVQDAADHFAGGGLGTELLAVFAARRPQEMVVTAHSAGSIWASRMLIAMQSQGMNMPLRLFLLAPAVRNDLFAEVIANAGSLVGRCRMFAMSDRLEAADAVLGHDRGYIYPSSLLYLVSGMFEEADAKAYVDSPLLGMQRFAGAAFLTPQEAADAHAIAAFFNQPDKAIVYSPAPGICEADTHGGFDDEPKTLASVKALF